MILQLTLEHLAIVVLAMVLSIVIGVATGMLITLNRRAAAVVLAATNVMMTIPSLALFSLLVPLVGIGSVPAIIGLVAYTQLPVVRNVYTGLSGIDPSIIEAARGMGLSSRSILWKIRAPLALPAMMAGIRTAVVMGVGIGAIAGYIGAGGLGVLIFQGISRNDDVMVLTGAGIISLIAILADRLMRRIETLLDRRARF
jgi:osmoprotectant transport system permease protein